MYFGDERAVPPDHPDSNYLMVHRVLLSRVPVPAGQVHRMEAERSDREAAAREYERSLPPRLDILVLGMGPDGHTASLFPGSAALDERQRLVVPVIGAKAPVERLTITPPVIEAARRVAVIATGEDKAAMVARAIEGPLAPKEVPVQLARRGSWFLDRSRGWAAHEPEGGDVIVLGGDVGGTNARLAVVELDGRTRPDRARAKVSEPGLSGARPDRAPLLRGRGGSSRPGLLRDRLSRRGR